MKRTFSYLIATIFLTISVSAFAQQERIINWDFSSAIGGKIPFDERAAWNEFNFDRNEIVQGDLGVASNARALRCYINKEFFGKDSYGVGQYAGRAQSIIPCPEPGTEYTFSARARVVNELEGEGPGEVALFFYNEQGEVIYKPVFYFSGTSYEEQTQTITVPADAVWSRVWVLKGGRVDFYTDWVSLKATVDDTPGEVTGFTASDIGTSKVLLEWDPVVGASGYQIERKGVTDDAVKWRTMFITQKGGSSTSYLDSRDTWFRQIEADTTYNYRIRALGDYGKSATTTLDVSTIAIQTTSPGNTTYYVDATNGDDVADGISSATAWKSFMNIDRMELAPGDSVLLKRGEYWNESLILHGNGEAGNEITIASYGTAAEKPVINVEAVHNAAIRMVDISYYRVQDLELSNYHPFFRELAKFAVEAGNWRVNSVSGLHFDNLFINKVRGAGIRGANGGFIDNGELTAGIRLANDIRRSKPDDKMIYNASITNCVFKDIEQHGMHLSQIDGLEIKNNVVKRGGYTGMLCRRLYNGTIANNYFLEGGYYMTCDDNAGVGFYGGDNILFEKNVVYKTYNQASGQSLNMDGTDNWIVQYNYFKDSESGCFVLNHAADGNIFRYNISEGFNDQWFRNLGGINTKIYNNTAYVYATNNAFFISNSKTVSNNPTPTSNTQVYNNIYYREASDIVDDADLIIEALETINSEFSNNVFYGNFSDEVPEDINPFFDDPLFVNPGFGSVDMDNPSISVDGYQLQVNTPYNNRGIIIPDNGGFDFWENELYDDYRSIGAYQGLSEPNAVIDHSVESNTADLLQNYPNPFNSITNIQYSVPESDTYNEQEVKLSIYDLHGRKIKTLVNESQKSGVYTVEWNRKGDSGKAVGDGIYFYRIKIGDFFKTRSMILLD
ncbi:MAG: right-handed parallel beta-helix repeat-containing protein [Bacteroidota bacterium]